MKAPKSDSKPAAKSKPEAKPVAKPSKTPKTSKTDKDSDEETKEDDGDRMPGQRFATPDDGEGLKIFYETLYEQKPGNKFAEKWLLEHGLFSMEKAAQLVEVYYPAKKKK